MCYQAVLTVKVTAWYERKFYHPMDMILIINSMGDRKIRFQVNANKKVVVYKIYDLVLDF